MKKFIRLVSSNVYSNFLKIFWEAREIVEQESDKFKRWIKESIHIRTNTPTMNMDEEAYLLLISYISTPNQAGGGGGGDLDRATS